MHVVEIETLKRENAKLKTRLSSLEKEKLPDFHVETLKNIARLSSILLDDVSITTKATKETFDKLVGELMYAQVEIEGLEGLIELGDEAACVAAGAKRHDLLK